MTKVILQVYPTVGDTTEMARRRPIGRDSDAYQAMLASLVELVQAADTLGYWGITHVEHHAHSEGLEISPDPLLLNVYLGHFTKRLMHGQLGIVVPTHDPVRLAAQIAIAESWSRKFGQRDRWSFCLMTGTLCPSNQERS